MCQYVYYNCKFYLNVCVFANTVEMKMNTNNETAEDAASFVFLDIKIGDEKGNTLIAEKNVLQM